MHPFLACENNQSYSGPFVPGWKFNVLHFRPPSQAGVIQYQGHLPAPGTLYGLVGKGVTHGSDIGHYREFFSSATNRSTIGYRGAHLEGLCPNDPPGEADVVSLMVHHPGQGGYSPPYWHGCEYRDTGCRCPVLLNTPTAHCLPWKHFIHMYPHPL